MWIYVSRAATNDRGVYTSIKNMFKPVAWVKYQRVCLFSRLNSLWNRMIQLSPWPCSGCLQQTIRFICVCYLYDGIRQLRQYGTCSILTRNSRASSGGCNNATFQYRWKRVQVILTSWLTHRRDSVALNGTPPRFIYQMYVAISWSSSLPLLKQIYKKSKWEVISYLFFFF